MSNRFFLAINLSRKVKERLTPVVKELREIGATTPDPQNLHITLKFLGNLNPQKLQKLKEILEDVNFSQMRLELSSVGAFPNKEYVRVIWIGVNSKSLNNFVKKLNKKLGKLFEVEENFVAHITLARVSQKLKLSKFFDRYNNKKFITFNAKSFELMNSQLLKDGPKYSIVWSSQSSR